VEWPAELGGAAKRLPALAGRAILVRFLPDLTARGRRLESGTGRGTEVHAGSFPRKREMVLDAALRGKELTRIFVHEVFHFAWLRLGNARRLSFEDLLHGEAKAHARGELGWSAASRKQGLGKQDRRNRTRRWREYVCESFCDTAAWHLSGVVEHEEFTLSRRWRNRRAEWFERLWEEGAVRV